MELLISTHTLFSNYYSATFVFLMLLLLFDENVASTPSRQTETGFVDSDRVDSALSSSSHIPVISDASSSSSSSSSYIRAFTASSNILSIVTPIKSDAEIAKTNDPLKPFTKNVTTFASTSESSDTTIQTVSANKTDPAVNLLRNATANPLTGKQSFTASSNNQTRLPSPTAILPTLHWRPPKLPTRHTLSNSKINDNELNLRRDYGRTEVFFCVANEKCKCRCQTSIFSR